MKVAIPTTDSREHFKDYHAPEPYFGTAVEALLQGIAKVPEIEAHVISCLKQPVAPKARIASNIYYHGLLVPGRWVRKVYAGNIRAVRRTLREIQPDIVHGHGTERDCALSAVLSGFPNIITIHGNVRMVRKAIGAPFFSPLTLQSVLEAWCVRKTAGVICLTSHTLKQVKDGARRTWILPNAVNESYFDVRRHAQSNNNVICIANIGLHKNQQFLMRALDPIAEALGLRLVFLGAGVEGDPYSAKFEEMVRARAWCVYEGFKRGEELKEHLRSARMLVLPSLEDNCPMAVLEAMAVGLPVAAARSGGTPDLVEDGVNGLLFDPENEESARNAIQKLFTDRAFADRMAETGKERALQRHHPLAVAREHLNIYRAALNARS